MTINSFVQESFETEETDVGFSSKKNLSGVHYRLILILLDSTISSILGHPL